MEELYLNGNILTNLDLIKSFSTKVCHLFDNKFSENKIEEFETNLKLEGLKIKELYSIYEKGHVCKIQNIHQNMLEKFPQLKWF